MVSVLVHLYRYMDTGKERVYDYPLYRQNYYLAVKEKNRTCYEICTLPRMEEAPEDCGMQELLGHAGVSAVIQDMEEKILSMSAGRDVL